MKRLTIPCLIAIAIAGTATATAGPFGRIFNRSQCGPKGCDIAPAVRVNAVNDADPIQPVAKTEPEDKKFVGPKFEYRATPPLESWQTHGVERDAISDDHHPHVSIDGRRVLWDMAKDAMMDDDSPKLWLLLIGDGRDKVAKDLAGPENASLMGRTRVWSVPANHWSLYDRETGKPMWSVNGNPSICLLQPDGSKLFERDGYRGSPDLDDLRKSDPAAPVTPPKKPNPSPLPEPLPSNGMPLIPLALLIGGGAVISYRLTKGSRT